MRQVVYIDEVLLVNLIMNLLPLWLTAQFTGRRFSIGRSIAGSAFGAIYALFVFVPGWSLLATLAGKLPVAGIMLLIALGFTGVKDFIKFFGLFLLASFSLAGVALGLEMLFSPMVLVNSDFHLVQPISGKWEIIMLTSLISLLVGKYGPGIINKRQHQKNCSVPVTVNLWGKQVSLKALVDTGNQLVDPLSNHPVVIIEFEALKGSLPSEISELFIGGFGDGSQMLLTLSDTPYIKRLRVIPFKSLGKENGMLLGIRPDFLVIEANEEKRLIKDVVVGLYHNKLSPESAYTALLHPELVA